VRPDLTEDIKVIINNDELRRLLQDRYTPQTLALVREVLNERGTLKFDPLSTGLFSAAHTNQLSARTGYKSAWVRDNVHIAHSLWICGDTNAAVRTVSALAKFFSSHRHRFLNVIEDPSLAKMPYNRPHVRFDGETLTELPEKWSHDQNDALGYFLWLHSRLAAAGVLAPDPSTWETLFLLPRYFQAIQYWQDEDSGHWEESPRKIAASSIGTVLAGLKEMKRWLGASPEAARQGRTLVTEEFLDELIASGAGALDAILPWESRGSYMREYDSALLFLIYPLNVLSDSQAWQIVDIVANQLQGEYGIKRYLGDSFYCANYETNLKGRDLTKDFSDDMAMRDSFFVAGGEAQWCLFDPIISIYYGLEFRQSRDEDHLVKQTKYLNRSLGQITGASGRNRAFQCPELYYFENGRLQTSKSTPLLWTQANLSIALQTMAENL
jgi:phosphorylase kinase alpha/beta subunit